MSQLFNRFHHVAIICSNYEVSRKFYVNTLGLRVVSETFRPDRQSHKLNLAIPGGGELELFSFPDPPARPNYPEACGLRHLAFETMDLEQSVADLNARGIAVEAIRIDPNTQLRFTFFQDPDGLPIELYEAASG